MELIKKGNMEKIKIKLNNSELVELYSLLNEFDFNRLEKKISPMSKQLCIGIYKRLGVQRISQSNKHTLSLNEAEATALGWVLGNAERKGTYRENLVLKLRMIIDQKLS